MGIMGKQKYKIVRIFFSYGSLYVHISLHNYLTFHIFPNERKYNNNNVKMTISLVITPTAADVIAASLINL